MKCESCKVHEEVLRSDVPACCKWFMDNVVLGDYTVEDCTEYEPVKCDDTESFNDFESCEDSEEYCED